MTEAGLKLIIFAKAPIPGFVNTRLLPDISPEDAAKLQAYFIEQTLALVSNLNGVALELRCAPNTAQPIFQQYTDANGIVLKPQQGNDLGERMANAMQEALTQYRQVVIIGTDCPEITIDYLDEAFLQLRRGSTAVIGPANDGGYVLIGLNRFSPVLFRNINWGSDQVLSETRVRLQQLGWDWYEMKTLRDIDTLADLLDFPEIIGKAGLVLNNADVLKVKR